jgi:hypothetical protein
MQSLADVLDIPAAGLAVGFWPDVEDLRAQWRKAVARTVDWVDEDDDD